MDLNKDLAVVVSKSVESSFHRCSSFNFTLRTKLLPFNVQLTPIIVGYSDSFNITSNQNSP